MKKAKKKLTLHQKSARGMNLGFMEPMMMKVVKSKKKKAKKSY